MRYQSRSSNVAGFSFFSSNRQNTIHRISPIYGMIDIVKIKILIVNKPRSALFFIKCTTSKHTPR